MICFQETGESVTMSVAKGHICKINFKFFLINRQKKGKLETFLGIALK